MRSLMLLSVLVFSASAFAQKETLRVNSCAVRASHLEANVKAKLSDKSFDLQGTGKISSDVLYKGPSSECPSLEQSNYSNGLVVIGMLHNKESIKIPMTDVEALLSQNCSEPIEIQSLAKLCIYEISADGSTKLVHEKKKDFAANILRADSEVKDAARKWLAKQIPECKEN